MERIDLLTDQLAALDAQLGSSAAVVAVFDGELARMRETAVFTNREVSTLSSGLSGGLRRAFDGLVFDGMKLSDALQTVAKTMVDTIYAIAMKPGTAKNGAMTWPMVARRTTHNGSGAAEDIATSAAMPN